jgi:hypothetical protein
MILTLWLFSLRANAWKEILCTTRLPFYSDASSFVYVVESVYNEAIHWLVFRHDLYVHVIVAFHLTERKPLEIPLLVDIIDHDFTDCSLWVFKGFLFYPLSRTKSGDIIGSDCVNGLVKYNDKGDYLEHNSYFKDAHGFRLTM